MTDLLNGLHLISLAVNLPGPVAAHRLAALGAQVTKIEPPGGDPLAVAAPDLYAALCAGQTVRTLDLKTPEGQAELDRLLGQADLLLTSSRPQALARLGLDWPTLHARHPRLCMVAIVGHLPPEENRPGHDLTYVAIHGLVEPPHMPRTLVADLGGAEQAVSAALALLLHRERTGQAGCQMVSLAEAAAHFALPLRHGLTAPGGLLGGGLPGYRIYPAADGWIALAALEPHFWQRVLDAFGLQHADAADLAVRFRARPVHEWEAWARAHDIPLARVQTT